MLSKLLYNLCFLLLTPYENLNVISNNFHYLDNSILEEIYLKKLFNFKWRKTINSSFKNFHFDYNYNILEKDSNFIKLVLTLKISFITENHLQDITSACIHDYIIILEHLQNNFKLQLLVENEEKPILYNHILNTDLSNISSIAFYKNQNLYKNKISNIDLAYEIFNTSNFSFENNTYHRNDSNFNIDEACSYAENYALNPNPNYKSFEGIGGDCTNFISQILYAGGIKQTTAWKPYTNPWIRVEDIYLYLTSQKLGIKLPNDTFLDKGCLIQFYTPSIGKFFHNGFITYKLQNNDCLYCCHSYNKLNYPLSQIYPDRYPKLRALKFN